MSGKKKARVSHNFFDKLPSDCVANISQYLTIRELQLMQLITRRNIAMVLTFQAAVSIKYNSLKLFVHVELVPDASCDTDYQLPALEESFLRSRCVILFHTLRSILEH